MKSHVAVTYQIDDVRAASDELLAGIGAFGPGKNSAGLLFCYSDTDVSGLVAAVADRVAFDVIGCTCIANMDEREGFHDMAATLTVLTADDCTFAAASSEAVTPDNVAEQIEKTYLDAAHALGETPKLLIAIPPYRLEIMLDAYSQTFNDIAPGVPVVGGLPSYNGAGDSNMTFFGGQTHADRLVVLAVGGNARPVFSVQNVESNDADRKRKVTRAKDNVVYEVSGQRFTDYLKEIGLPVERLTQGNTTITFVSNPLLLEKTSENGESEYSFARTLHEIDLEAGSGTAIGRIPDGATLSVCSLQRDEIERAAGEGIRDLKQKMEASGGGDYAYSTVLAVSCIGRHLLMLPNSDAEVRQMMREFPAGLTLSGFYSYGEIGPQGVGQAQNFAHNESLVLCAF